MKDSIISILGTPVRVIVDDFDVYVQHDAFLAASIDDPTADFIAWLISAEQVSTIDDHSGVIDPGTAYLLWDIAPTAVEMQAIRDLLKDNPHPNLKPHHLEMLATGHRMGTDLDRSFEEHLEWLSRDVSMVEMVTQLVSAHLAGRQLAHIQQSGRSVQSVLSEEGSDVPQYSHTVGLTLKLGYELIVVGAAEDGPAILDVVAERLTSAIDPLHIGEVAEITEILTNGRPLRARVVSLDMDKVGPDITISVPADLDVNDIKQVMISDANLILPGEAGYDESFVQELTSG